jgi:DNA-binding transcriptional ArsR family regulator
VGAQAHRAGVRRRAVPGLNEVFGALADPTRREVLRSLAEQPGLTASRLAGELPMTRQAVAKHLHALSGAGLVQARREGRETRYTLTPAPLAEAIDWMTAVGAEWDERLQRLRRSALSGPARAPRSR